MSPEYIAHIPNGLVVDIIPQSHDQQGAIYSNAESVEPNSSPLEMTTDGHYISNGEHVGIESIHQSLHSGHSSIQTDRNHFDAGPSIHDRKVIISEPGRQYILTNEAPVIVSNKVNQCIK